VIKAQPADVPVMIHLKIVLFSTLFITPAATFPAGRSYPRSKFSAGQSDYSPL